MHFFRMQFERSLSVYVYKKFCNLKPVCRSIVLPMRMSSIVSKDELRYFKFSPKAHKKCLSI